jgi:pyrroline-5-carboxylate reductase
MGGAVLEGLLDALSSTDADHSAVGRIARFIACTNTKSSSQKLEQQLSRHSSRLEVLHSSNVAAMQSADVIVLGVKPFLVKKILEETGVREALAGKLIMSMIPSPENLQTFINAGSPQDDKQAPRIVKTIPNIAARYRQSLTLIEEPCPRLPAHEQEFLEWFWNQIGTSKTLLPEQMNAGMMAMTCGLAALSVPLEGLLDASVREGLRRSDAMDVAVQSMKGLVTLLESGLHPAVLREMISSPRGCTIATLLSLEKAGARGVFAQAFLDGAEVFRG